MPKAFISYRREDSQDVSGRLYDHLVVRWGAERVFKDVDSIPIGMDFREHLTEAVGGCEVMLVVIGPRWVDVSRDGRRRLEDPLDFVRIEVEAALQRGVPVVPVLVGGASVPAPEELPESLRALAFRQASVLRPDPDFRGDVARIIHGVERMPVRSNPGPTPAPPAPPPPLPRRAPPRATGPSLSGRIFRGVGRGLARTLPALRGAWGTVSEWAGGAGRDLAVAGRLARSRLQEVRASRAAARRAKPPPMPPAREVSAGLFWGVVGPLLLAAVVFGLLLGKPWEPDQYDQTHGFGFLGLFLAPCLALCGPLIMGSRSRVTAALSAAGASVLSAGVGLIPFVAGGFGSEAFLAWGSLSGLVAIVVVPLRATVFWGMPKDHAACVGPPTAPPSASPVTRE